MATASPSEGVTAVELKRLVRLLIGVRAVARGLHLSSKSLNNRRWQNCGKFGEMGTAFDIGKTLPDAIAKTLEEVQADQLLVVGGDGVAKVRVWNRVGNGFRIDDIQADIDGDAKPEIQPRLTGRPNPGSKRGMTSLYICYMRIDIPQAVVARERFELDCARVL